MEKSLKRTVEAAKKSFKPVDGVVPALRKLTRERSYKAFFMRKTTHNLMENLTEPEQDAMMQIALAHQMFFGSWVGMHQFKYGEVYGRQMQEFTQWAIDLLTLYRKWCAEMKSNPRAFNICIAVCTTEQTMTEITRENKMRRARAFAHLREAFAEWGKLAGWH